MAYKGRNPQNTILEYDKLKKLQAKEKIIDILDLLY